MENTQQLTKDNVQRWLNQGMSHNDIASYVGVSKTTVTRFIGDNPDIIQPSKSLSGIGSESVRTEPKSVQNLHLASEASNYYQTKRIADLEDALREAKNTLSEKERELNKTKLEKDTIERKLETFEERKSLEIERIQLQNAAEKTGGLSGFVDKIAENEKLSNIAAALIGKLVGVDLNGEDVGTEQAQLASSDNPIIQAYLENIKETLESVDNEVAGKIITVAKALALPTSLAALNQLFDKVTNPQPKSE